MTGNRSLDEFAGGVEDDRPADVDPREEDTDADASGAETLEADDTDTDDASGADPEEAAVEPVASTYAWSPEGGECAACGAAVEERWRDGDDLVCLDCKEW